MKKRLGYGLILLIFFISGCSMIPEYSKPGGAVPEEFDTANKNIEKAESALDIKWEDFFKDEKLKVIIATALENNKDLELASLDVEKMRTLYKIKRDDLLPTIGVGASGSKQRVPGDLSMLGRSTENEKYGIDLGVNSWEIDFFGRLKSLEKKALQEYMATEYARKSAQIVLVSQIAEAYVTFAADMENLSLAKSTYDTQKSSYDLIENRYDSGLATRLDLKQAQTRVDSAKTDIEKFKEIVVLDHNRINFLAGTIISAELLPEDLSDAKGFYEFSPGISSRVLLNRPDVLRSESMLKAANANIGAARAAFFPKIALTSTIGTASAELSGLFNSGSDTWLFGSSVSIPVFNPGVWSNLRVSKVQKKIAVAQYQKTIQSAFRDASDVLAGKAAVKEQIKAQESLVNAAKEAYELSNERYEIGTGPYLNVLDAQRSFYAAKQGLILIKQKEMINQINLYSVFGGGGNESSQPVKVN